MTGDISPLFSLAQYDASNLLGFPRSTFCRKWKQATACSAAAASGAPAEFFEGQSQKNKKSAKRQSLGKPQTVYRRWPYRRLKMIEERMNSLLYSEGEPLTGQSIDLLVELLTERVLLSEPVFFEINPAHSKYTAPTPVYPKQILEQCQEDAPIDLNATILSLVSKLPAEVISAFPVPFSDSIDEPKTHSSRLSSSSGSVASVSSSRGSLFETGLASTSAGRVVDRVPSFRSFPDSFLESFLSSISGTNPAPELPSQKQN